MLNDKRFLYYFKLKILDPITDTIQYHTLLKLYFYILMSVENTLKLSYHLQ